MRETSTQATDGDPGFEFTRGLDHASIVAASERVAWSVDEVFGDRRFDPSGAIVPPSWVGTQALGFLDEEQQRTLNHCRAFSYVHLLGNFEEFVPLHLATIVGGDGIDARAHLRSLLRFGEEELKHQELFRRAERVLEESCGHRFGRHFDEQRTAVGAFTRAILDHPPLARYLIVLALEWGTQRHYVESIREATAPLYADILKAHWVEEVQHTKTDALEIARLAEAMRPGELALAFEHTAAIGALVDSAFAGQAAREVETVEQVTGRRLSPPQAGRLREALHRSLGAIMAGVGLDHPRFTRVALELSPAGAAKLGIG